MGPRFACLIVLAASLAGCEVEQRTVDAPPVKSGLWRITLDGSTRTACVGPDEFDQLGWQDAQSSWPRCAVAHFRTVTGAFGQRVECPAYDGSVAYESRLHGDLARAFTLDYAALIRPDGEIYPVVHTRRFQYRYLRACSAGEAAAFSERYRYQGPSR